MDSSPRELRIPLDGRDTSVELSSIPLDRLLLDEDNPRISFFKDNQVVATLTEQQIEFALSQGNPESWRKLKDSIHNNRGVVTPICQTIADSCFPGPRNALMFGLALATIHVGGAAGEHVSANK